MKTVFKLLSLLALITVGTPTTAHYYRCQNIKNRADREACYHDHGLVSDAWHDVFGYRD